MVTVLSGVELQPPRESWDDLRKVTHRWQIVVTILCGVLGQQ